ncbi:MAG: glycosyltransferase [Ginsengibacter sp.]|jgi:cellulose synthase/poly-beta-1,6-N-acetylglucosamine synthase-like glycosyltransferase
MSWQSILVSIFQYGLLIYSVVLLSFYVFIGIFSIREVKKYLFASRLFDPKDLAISSLAPSVSIIAPAYNEGISIVDNVRSLLSVYYSNLEIIVVNDGSKDDSLDKLIVAYELQKIPFYFNQRIKTKTVLGVYKSKNPVFKKLIVVDKENGGKSDALNVGINVSANKLMICIDVDCIMEQDAVLKIIKPFLSTNTVPVVCSGGVVRIANSCVIENGRLIKVALPDKFMLRVQTLEYIRAFLLGRMAWSRLNGLLIVSGAFGAFDKEIVVSVGGYETRTVGEDMELVVRMRRYLEEKRIKYQVTYIPDPLCWTEVPSDYKTLLKQRSRWMRGLVETLFAHRRIFFNPSYRVLGMLSYPYWFFYEFLAPIVETVGMFIFLVFWIFGMVGWGYFWQLFIFIISFGYLFSSFAILMEVLTYNQYKDRKDISRLIGSIFLEPVIFHLFIVGSSLNGLVHIIQEKTGWGEMKRKGFGLEEGKDEITT